MTEETKTKIAGAVETTKHQLWKWIGALFMEPKTGSDGVTYQAASLSKVLTLGTWIAVMVYFYAKPTEVPDQLVWTLWGMLGLKVGHMASNAIRSRNGQVK